MREAGRWHPFDQDPFDPSARIIYMCVEFFPKNITQWVSDFSCDFSCSCSVQGQKTVINVRQWETFLAMYKKSREDTLWNICYMDMLYCGQLNAMTWSSVSIFSFVVFKCSQWRTISIFLPSCLSTGQSLLELTSGNYKANITITSKQMVYIIFINY